MNKLDSIRALIQDLTRRYGPSALVLRSWVTYELSLSNPTISKEEIMHVAGKPPKRRKGGNMVIIGLCILFAAVLGLIAVFSMQAAGVDDKPTPENRQPQTLSQSFDLEIEALLLSPTGDPIPDRSIQAAVIEGDDGAEFRMGDRPMFMTQLEIESAPFWSATNGARYSLMLKPWETRSNRGDPVTVLCRGYYGGVEVPVVQTTDSEGYTTCVIQRAAI